MMKNKICVLGGSGMLGSALVEVLTQNENNDVVSHNSELCDLTNSEETKKYIRHISPTTIFNCAGLVGGILTNMNHQYEHLYVNTSIAINAAHAAVGASVPNYFYISSSCMYPAECEQPMREHMLLSGSPEKTNQGYALAKIVGGEITKFIMDQRWLNYRTFIPCNLYGPKDDFTKHGHVLGALISKICDAKRQDSNIVSIWGDGTARREFLHVDDCAKALVLASEKTTEPFVNIGSGYDVSIVELAGMISRVVKWEGEFSYDRDKPNGMMKKLLDTRIIRSTGFVPSISLLDGIGLMVGEYNKCD